MSEVKDVERPEGESSGSEMDFVEDGIRWVRLQFDWRPARPIYWIIAFCVMVIVLMSVTVYFMPPA